MTEATEAPIQALTGQDLIDAIKRHTAAGMRKRQVIMACGYVSHSKDGRAYASTNEFYDALAEAKNLQVGATPSRPGRSLSFQTHVQTNGGIVVSPAYCKRLGLAIGTRLDIILQPETQSLRLAVAADQPAKQVEEAEETEEAATAAAA